MTVEFILVPSLEKLCSLIENSKGAVFLQQSDKIFINMKQSHCLIKELQNVLNQGKKIKVHIFDPKDCSDFITLMAGIAYNKSTAY